ncbi:MAG: lysine--tRNA ligase [Patescibacteria group bacterium]|jgi:lysyl-tRNA synthetase class 2
MRKFSEQEQIRRDKLEVLRSKGVNPYPSRGHRDVTLAEAVEQFDALKGKKALTIAGRVRAIRGHGGSSFITLEDGSGSFQAYLKKDTLGDEAYTLWQDGADIGDVVSCTGTLFTTKKGEKTLEAKSFLFLAKALAPLPEKWHGLADIEVRYRKRHLDLLSNLEVREIFRKRAVLLTSIRTFLDAHDFLEVETPILQSIAGGAVARPFVTHHNAHDTDFYLRIAPELYLKRLIAGGFDRVYEIGKSFRNEGIDQSHSPEFTMLEFYMAYANYEELMDLTEDFIATLVKDVLGKLELTYQKQKISFKKPFQRKTFDSLLKEHAGVTLAEIRAAKAKDIIAQFTLDIPDTAGVGKIADELYKERVRKNLIEPTFLIDHPVELLPLAKRREDDPMLVESFQLIAGGMELVKAFSELNDPIDQEQRFTDQAAQKAKGDAEAHEMDLDYVQTLETGMPPTAGFGLGVDRFMMMLADTQNLKEVILFPTLKPEQS